MPITYEPIATSTLGSAGTFTFSSIPSTYTDLRIVIFGIAGNSPSLRFNGDSGTTYSFTSLYGAGTSSGSYGTANTNQVTIANGVGPDNTTPYLATADVFSYAGSTNKTVLTTISNGKSGTGSVERSSALWRSTSAINSVTIFGTGTNFAAGTTATIYGIKAA